MDKRSKILEAFSALMLENPNLNEVSVKNIADKAGIGKGTVYEYFDSKADIIKMAVERLIDSMSEEYLILNYEGLGYEESLRKYIENIVDASKKIKKFSSYNHFTIKETFKFVDLKEIFYKKVIKLLITIVDNFKEYVVSKGLAEGKVDPEIDDIVITILVKMINRDIAENMEFEVIELEALKEALYKMTIKLLKK